MFFSSKFGIDTAVSRVTGSLLISTAMNGGGLVARYSK